jgi:hypothetical protein
MTPQLVGLPTFGAMPHLVGPPTFGLGAPVQLLAPSPNFFQTYKSTIFGVLALASMAASTYHGYRRNKSIGWALVWGVAGGLFPVVTPAIAVAQGFAKPKAA